MVARSAGVTLPLSSLRSARDWGIGEIGDLAAAAAWVGGAGFRLVQLLPVHELSQGENSPYGARTAFGLDPIYLSLSEVDELDGAIDARFLGEEAETERQRLRATANVDFGAVRALKDRALDVAFERFVTREWDKGTERARELSTFIASEGWWEDDLSLYVAIRHEQREHGWETWPVELRDRHPEAIAAAKQRLNKRILRHQYEQWQLARQWGRARSAIEARGMRLMGDLPFVVARESADVWAHRALFKSGMSLGAPPDEFAPKGQDWGLPPYDWEALAASNHGWLRARASHAARLYHAFRVDHMIGLFREYVRRPKGTELPVGAAGPLDPARFGWFDPPTEASAQAHGDLVLRAILEDAHGADVIAEDLGVIPPWARATMRALGLPGYKVLLWERDERGKLRDPATFEPRSVATWSTHDTQPIGAWWDELTVAERSELHERMGLAANASGAVIERSLFELLMRAGSMLSLVLVTELLGERARINTPGTVGPHNWTYKLPQPIEELPHATRERLAMFEALLRGSARLQ